MAYTGTLSELQSIGGCVFLPFPPPLGDFIVVVATEIRCIQCLQA